MATMEERLALLEKEHEVEAHIMETMTSLVASHSNRIEVLERKSHGIGKEEPRSYVGSYGREACIPVGPVGGQPDVDPDEQQPGDQFVVDYGSDR